MDEHTLLLPYDLVCNELATVPQAAYSPDLRLVYIFSLSLKNIKRTKILKKGRNWKITSTFNCTKDAYQHISSCEKKRGGDKATLMQKDHI